MDGEGLDSRMRSNQALECCHGKAMLPRLNQEADVIDCSRVQRGWPIGLARMLLRQPEQDIVRPCSRSQPCVRPSSGARRRRSMEE